MIEADATGPSGRAMFLAHWQQFVRVREDPAMELPARLYTANPGLFEALRAEGYAVKDADACVADAETQEIGHAVHGLSSHWQARLNGLDLPDVPDVPWGDVLARAPHHLLVGLVYHRELLRRAAADGVLAVPYKPRANDAARGIAPVSANYFAILAEGGCTLPGVAFRAVEGPDPESADYYPGDTDAGERPLFAFEIRLLQLTGRRGLPFGHLILKAVRARGGLRGPSLGRRARSAALEVWIFMLNDLFVSALPRLLSSGVRLRCVDAPNVADTARDDAVFEAVRATLDDSAREAGADERIAAVAPIAAERIAEYMARCLVPTARRMQERHGLSGPAADRDRAPILLTNGVYDPIENLTAALYRSLAGARVVCVQHGGIGLLRHYRTMMRFSDMSRCDGYVCFNPMEADYYRKWCARPPPRFHIAGAWSSVGAPLPSVSRWIVRRYWGVGRREPLVLYAPTRFKEGHFWFPDGIRDMAYWRIMRTVVTDALASVTGRAVVKVHRKGVSPRGMRRLYRLRKSPLDSIDLPAQVEVRGYPDLTYCRHAADIIIIDRATSTIGWALASEAIVIYLETQNCPLEDDVRDRMKAALFYVDATSAGWVDRLRGILRKDLRDLRKQWETKAQARESFLADCVLGPRASDDEFVSFLQDVGRLDG